MTVPTAKPATTPRTVKLRPGGVGGAMLTMEREVRLGWDEEQCALILASPRQPPLRPVLSCMARWRAVGCKGVCVCLCPSGDDDPLN